MSYKNTIEIFNEELKDIDEIEQRKKEIEIQIKEELKLHSYFDAEQFLSNEIDGKPWDFTLFLKQN